MRHVENLPIRVCLFGGGCLFAASGDGAVCQRTSRECSRSRCHQYGTANHSCGRADGLRWPRIWSCIWRQRRPDLRVNRGWNLRIFVARQSLAPIYFQRFRAKAQEYRASNMIPTARLLLSVWLPGTRPCACAPSMERRNQRCSIGRQLPRTKCRGRTGIGT
jgi:hypothetical protein